MYADELYRGEMKDTRTGSRRWKPTRVVCSHPLSINWLSEEGTWFMSPHFHVNVPTTADARLWCDITSCGVIGACHSAFSARQMTWILSILKGHKRCPCSKLACVGGWAGTGLGHLDLFSATCQALSVGSWWALRATVEVPTWTSLCDPGSFITTLGLERFLLSSLCLQRTGWELGRMLLQMSTVF